jgi:CheY-like chemotaxis protein
MPATAAAEPEEVIGAAPLAVRGPLATAHTAPSRPTAVPVLVVDDSLINRLVTSRMLEHLGYATVTVDSGEAALAALVDTAFSVILTDCYMPEMDGFTLAEKIRVEDARIPILAMTADVLDETRERCLQAGMNDCLTKPVRIEQLQHAIESWAMRADVPVATPA